MPSAIIYVIITCAETKILIMKTKWTVRLFKVFTLRLDCKLMKGNKNQTS